MKNIVFLLILFSLQGHSQVMKKSVTVKYINEEITIDGVLSESSWDDAKKATNFFQYFPTDTVQAKRQAEIQFLLMIVIFMGIKVDAKGKNYIVPSLRRDFRAEVAIILPSCLIRLTTVPMPLSLVQILMV